MEKDTPSNLTLFIEQMNKVYGECKDQQEAETWKPKLFKEGQGRYLWTDAFGVCNYLTLYCETQEKKYLIQADKLIENVHDILGFTRDKKTRLGDATEQQPTLGGIRIGKPDPETSDNGDGQYFHYITKWLFALNRMTQVTKDKKYNQWAVDLVKAVHKYFIYDLEEYFPKIYWKISIDRQKPIITAEGILDPFDGFATYQLVQEDADDKQCLITEIQQLEKIVKVMYKNYKTTDPLDLGQALWITHWFPKEAWSQHITEVSHYFLSQLKSIDTFNEQEEGRFAFREFGTCLGVKSQSFIKEPNFEQLMPFIQQLMDFWKDKLQSADCNITPVMYCASLIPGILLNGYYKLK